MQKFDVAVIGLGAVGSAALYQLSHSNASVVGIDRYKPPHSHGSSHGESRIMRLAIGEGEFYVPIALRSAEIWRTLAEETGRELFNSCGFLLTSQRDMSFYDATVRAANKFDIAHELLDAEQVEALFPAIKMSASEVAYFEPAGGFVRPEDCLETQLGLAQNNGAQVLTEVSVTRIVERYGGVQISLNNDDKVLANKAVIAMGSWVRDLISPDIGNIFTTYLQTQYWFALDPQHYDKLLPGKLPVFSREAEPGWEPASYYGMPALSGVAGGVKFCVHDTPLTDESSDEHNFTTTELAPFYERLSEYLRFVTPNIVKSTECRYTVTPDEHFVIDWLPDSERILLVSPCSGHGFKHSAAVGEIVAQLITRGDTDFDVSHFSLSRFTR